MNERYHRQMLIKGWNQKKLDDALVTIVGAGSLAQDIALPLTAMGVGKIRLVSDEKSTGEMFLDIRMDTDSRVHNLESALKQVNPAIETQGLASRLVNEASIYFLEQSSLIIDATNDSRSKAIAVEYANETKTPLIIASGSNGFAKALRHQGSDFESLLYGFNNLESEPFTSIVMGGAIAEEAKKILMNHKDLLETTLYYNASSDDRFSHEYTGGIEREIGEFRKLNALIVGGGALGVQVAKQLALIGVGNADVIDPDTVEETNLNRQYLFYDCINDCKAIALAKKIQTISRGLVKSTGMVDKFTHKSQFKKNYDIIFDCLDSFAYRAVVNDYALKNKIPLISGGTSYEAGQLITYVPDLTSCLGCVIDVYKLGEKTREERRRVGCLQAPNPSVIMTNQIIGGMMVAEARRVFNPDKFGSPLNGEIKYGALLENRFGYTKLENNCECKPQKFEMED